MAKIYKLTDNVLKNDDLLNSLCDDFGYELASTEPIILCKIVKQKLNGELCKGNLNGIYSNPKWIEKYYAPNKQMFENALGLEYENGVPLLSDRFKNVLTDWRIQIEVLSGEVNGWLGFASADPFDRAVYYSAAYLDKYCSKEIKALKRKGFVEEIDVEDK